MLKVNDPKNRVLWYSSQKKKKNQFQIFSNRTASFEIDPFQRYLNTNGNMKPRSKKENFFFHKLFTSYSSIKKSHSSFYPKTYLIYPQRKQLLSKIFLQRDNNQGYSQQETMARQELIIGSFSPFQHYTQPRLFILSYAAPLFPARLSTTPFLFFTAAAELAHVTMRRAANEITGRYEGAASLFLWEFRFGSINYVCTNIYTLAFMGVLGIFLGVAYFQEYLYIFRYAAVDFGWFTFVYLSLGSKKVSRSTLRNTFFLHFLNKKFA